MPVIPGTNEGQVLNAGSPVPIGSDSEARYQGETIAAFGKGLAALGGVLESAANQTARERNRLDVLNAMNAFQMKSLERRAEQQAAGTIDNDPTGFGAVKSYNERLKPDMEEIASGISDINSRALFLAEAGKTINEEATKIWADEVRKRAEVNKELTNQLVSSSGQIAWRDPSQIDNELAKTELAILESSDIPQDQKPIKVGEAKRSIIMDAIQGRLEAKKWGQAQDIFNSYANQGFTSKEKASILDEIRNSEWNDVNRTAKEETAAYNARMRKLKEPMLKFKYGMWDQIVNGASPESVQQTLNLAVASGTIPQEQADAISNPKTFTPEQDQSYSKSVIADAIRSGNVDAALEKVGTDMGINVSPNQATQIRDNLTKIKAQMQRDPVFSKKVTNADAAITSFESEPMVMGMSPAERAQITNQVEAAKSQFYNKLAVDPSQDPALLTSEVVQSALSHTYRFNEVKSAQNLVEITKLGEDLIRNRAILQKKGLLNEKIDQDHIAKLREIQRRKQELSLGIRGK